MKGKHLRAASSGMLAVSLSVATVSMNATAATPSSTTGSSPTEVSVFMGSPSAYSIANINTNWFTRYAEKKFNIKFDFVTAGSSGADTKQALLLASGNYPAVFWAGNFTPAQELQYGQQGILVPLNKYIQEYAPNIKKAMKTEVGMKQVMEAPNGNIYGIPQVNYCFHCAWSYKYWINTAWLKKVGLSMPKTTAQFQHVLQVFAAKKLGGKQTIGIDGAATGGWRSSIEEYLMNSFIYDDGQNHFLVNNGKVSFAPIQPQWQQGLAYIHSLDAAAFIDSEALTQDESAMDAQVKQGHVATFAEGASNDVIDYGKPGSNYKDWQVVPPLKGPKGVQYAAFLGQGPTSVSFAVTNKATPAQIEAVMKLANFVFTVNGTNMADFGPGGKFWTTKVNGTGLGGGKALYNVDSNAFYGSGAQQNWGWDQLGLNDQSKAWRNGGLALPEWSPDGAQTMLQDETKLYAGHQPKFVYPAAVWLQPSQVQQYQMLQTNINNYVSQWNAEFITGAKNINTDWNTYVKGIENLGLKQYLQMSQQAMGQPFNTSSFYK